MRRFANAIVTAGSPTIARGNEDRSAFRHRLLICRVVRGVCGSAIHGFALAIADADNRGRIAGVNQVLHRDQPAKRGSRVGAACHQDGSIGSSGARPFRIQNRLCIVGGYDSGIETVVCAARGRRMDARERGGSVAIKTESGAKSVPIRGREHVRVFDENDGLTLASDARIEEWIYVVNGGQICRHERVSHATKAVGKTEFGSPQSVQCAWVEVMQRNHPSDK